MKSDLLNQLRKDIKESSSLQVDYILTDEKIVSGNITSVFLNDSIDINCEIDLNNDYFLNLDNLELIGEYVNCDVCSAYTKTKEGSKLIEGYVSSTIAICRLSSTVYKIDCTMERFDKDANLSFETNIQCRLKLIYKKIKNSNNSII